MSEFVREELRRLIRKIPETDPTTGGYLTLLRGLEQFNAWAPSIDDILAVCNEDCAGCDQCKTDGDNHSEKCENSPETPLEKCEDNVVPFPVPEESPFPNEPDEPQVKEVERDEQSIAEPAQVSVENTYTLEQVRAALVQARRSKGLNLSEFFRGFGYSNMTDLPPDLYPQVMAKLEAM